MRKVRIKRRKGFTMLEMLAVMAIFAILMLPNIGNVIKNQEDTRLSVAHTELATYRDAISSAVIFTPAIVGDRSREWDTDGSTYSSKEAYVRLVRSMNEYLDDKLSLTWDESLKCYRSVGKDPWGGHYVLTEYPEDKRDANSANWQSRYDPTQLDTTELSCSIWSTGDSDSILEANEVGENSVGLGLIFTSGLVYETFHGVEDQYPYSGWTLPTFR